MRVSCAALPQSQIRINPSLRVQLRLDQLFQPRLDFFVRGWPGRVFAAIPLDRSRVANTTGLSTLLFIAHRVSLPDDLLSINPGSRVVPEETCHIW
jgi:hypothetical protein